MVREWASDSGWLVQVECTCSFVVQYGSIIPSTILLPFWWRSRWDIATWCTSRCSRRGRNHCNRLGRILGSQMGWLGKGWLVRDVRVRV